jgi:hypothetical protein
VFGVRGGRYGNDVVLCRVSLICLRHLLPRAGEEFQAFSNWDTARRFDRKPNPGDVMTASDSVRLFRITSMANLLAIAAAAAFAGKKTWRQRVRDYTHITHIPVP